MVRDLLLLVRRCPQIVVPGVSGHQEPSEALLLLHKQERHLDPLLEVRRLPGQLPLRTQRREFQWGEDVPYTL